jgi:hypothetical protein
MWVWREFFGVAFHRFLFYFLFLMNKFFLFVLTSVLYFNASAQASDWQKMNLKRAPIEVIETVLSNNGKKEIGIKEYKFNSLGYIEELKTQSFEFNQKNIHEYNYHYNSNNIIQSIDNYFNGQFISKSVYSYENNEITAENFDIEGKKTPVYNSPYEILAFGSPENFLTTENQQGDTIFEYTIDKAAKFTIPNLPHQNVIEYSKNEFEYDEHNNWITLTTKVLKAKKTREFTTYRAIRTYIYK